MVISYFRITQPMKKLFLVCLSAILIAHASWSQPELVKDIASAPAGIFGNYPYAKPSERFIAAGNFLYFPVTDQKGKELWRTDGTAEGTIRIADINKGAADSYVMGAPFNNTFLFVTKPGPGESYSKLWRTTGTPESTQLIGDLSLEGDQLDVRDIWFVNNNVVVLATNGSAIVLLQVNSSFQMSLLKELADDVDVTVSGSTAVGDARVLVLQRYENFTYQAEFWTTDATIAGTKMIASYDDYVEDFTARGPDIIFENSTRQVFNMTMAGTINALHDFGGVSVDRLLSFNASISFISTREGLWVTDGTSGNTIELLPDVVDVFEVFVTNNKAYFTGLDAVNTTFDFYESDGTPGGTTSFAEIRDSEATPYVTSPPQIASINDQLICPVTTVASGMELAIVSATGKEIIKDINAGLNGSDPHNFYTFNNMLYFAANDGLNGMEVWTTDGTPANTQMLKNIVEGTASGVTTKDLFELNDGIFFSAHSSGLIDDVWKTTGHGADAEQYFFTNSGNILGTAGDTIFMITSPMFIYKGNGVEEPKLVADLSTSIGEALHPSSNFSLGDMFIYNLFAFGGGTPYGQELWTIDWHTPGTALLKDIGPGLTDGVFGMNYGEAEQRFLKVSETKAIFAADDGVNGVELWTTDGTTGGTSMVKDIKPGNASSNPRKINAMLNGQVYFVANYGQIWKTDGTSGGTSMVMDFSSEVSTLVRMNDDIYATVFEGQNSALYKVTSAPWERILQINALPAEMIALDGMLYITTEGRLWTSDGTAENTKFMEIGTTPSMLYSFKEQVYFSANEQLWHAMGSTVAQPIADIEPLKFKGAGDLLFMTANSKDYGTELFKTAVVKFDQEIIFPEIAAKTVGDADFQLTASASSGLPITYEVVSGNVTITGNTVHIVSDGSVTIKAVQAGDDNFESAEASRSFVVNTITGLESAVDRVAIYPNPVEDRLHINQASLVKIIDTNGRELYNQFVNESIDLSSLSPGFYIAIINNASRIKFIKR